MEEAPLPGWSSTNRRHEEPYGWKTNIGVEHTARLAPRTPGAGALGHHCRTSGSLDRPFFSASVSGLIRFPLKLSEEIR